MIMIRVSFTLLIDSSFLFSIMSNFSFPPYLPLSSTPQMNHVLCSFDHLHSVTVDYFTTLLFCGFRSTCWAIILWVLSITLLIVQKHSEYWHNISYINSSSICLRCDISKRYSRISKCLLNTYCVLGTVEGIGEWGGHSIWPWDACGYEPSWSFLTSWSRGPGVGDGMSSRDDARLCQWARMYPNARVDGLK